MARLDDNTFQAVLFDLDGTLVDTAPDMVGVLQELQRDFGVAPVTYEYGRAHVSNGAIGLLRIAFPDVGEHEREELLCEYLGRYAKRLCRDSAVFGGLDEVLVRLEQAGTPWGVVTNKPAHLTMPLLEQLGLARRSACAVSGDTLPRRKPDPAPLLHACELANLDPERTIYVGDAQRDIEAGQRAGMGTVAAAYGYITPDDDVGRWGADASAATTVELAYILGTAVDLP